MKKISADRFVWKNHCGWLQYSIFNLWDFDHHKPKDGWEAIGYCDGGRVEIRPKPDQYAVLLERVSVDEWGDEDDIGETVWLHVFFLDEKEFFDYCDNPNTYKRN